ncbi:NAD kinase [Nosema granulosis]|uniref:NAD kinase n=1 Tax=Nosema granulosis TaxID=83296 RepID=A0A9P6H0S0_9MICR|nr:NAD kinase [Nosema granulosis]
MILIIKKSEELNSPQIEQPHEVIDLENLLRSNLELSKYSDLVILGGDGTILRSIHKTKNVPNIYTFNFGTLGYLTTFKKEEINKLSEILKGDKTNREIRKRLRLSNSFYILNEAVFTTRSRRLNKFILNIDNQQMVLSGDSLIVSTRTGSTGYNHSAGGPVLLCDCIVINIVAPNKSNFRPLVVDMASKIDVQILSTDGLVIADGVEYESMEMAIEYDGNEVYFVK